MLGLNALFWLFLPLKLGRAFTGEVRGMEELSRIFLLSPFDFYTVRSFLFFGSNQVFFLDKFIVMTPFSLGLCFMATAWYGTVSCFARKGAFPAVLTFLVFTGMLAFHTLAGIITLGSFLSALILIQSGRWHLDRADLHAARRLSIATAASAIILLPYLYLLLHGKESEQLVPLGISFKRTLGVSISGALAIVLAAFQVKRLRAERTAGARFFVLVTVFIVVYSLILILPGPNKYDKPPFFVFYPLAVVGGWTLAELPGRGRSFFRRKVVVVLIFIILFLPVNLLAMLGYINTESREMLSSWEREIAAWVRVNTSRDAVFFDSGDRTFLAVAGPRRYYYGRHSYSYEWGYDKKEMDRRRRVLDNLYSAEPLENSTLTALSEIDDDVYIIARDRESGKDSFEKLTRVPVLLQRVCTAGPISVLKVDKTACREASGVEHREPGSHNGL
jgi:hypothetical protein